MAAKIVSNYVIDESIINDLVENVIIQNYPEVGDQPVTLDMFVACNVALARPHLESLMQNYLNACKTSYIVHEVARQFIENMIAAED